MCCKSALKILHFFVCEDIVCVCVCVCVCVHLYKLRRRNDTSNTLKKNNFTKEEFEY